jgi:hypothetical protein
VTEAGRSPEPPLMAPPGRDAERDGLIEDTVPRSGLMSAPARSVANGKGKPDRAPESPAQSSTTADVPFPADGIRTPAPGTDNDPDQGERFSAAAAVLNGKLVSGRQAVRQAMTATNNWIANRTAKSDSPAGDDVGRPAGSGAGAPAPASAAPGSSVPGSAVPGSAAPGSPVTVEPTTVASGAPAAAASSTASSTGTAASSTGAAFGSVKPRPSFTEAPGASGPGGQAAQPTAAGQQYPPSRASAGWSPAQPGAARPTVTAARMPTQENSAKWRREAARRSRRQAQLTLARVEPWSVMKFSFVVSVVAFIILFVAVAVLYMALSGLGVFTSLQHTVSTITSSQGSSGTNISTWFSASRILGYTGIFGAFDIVLITAMSTIGAVVYNLIAHTIGGIEITLRETE